MRQLTPWRMQPPEVGGAEVTYGYPGETQSDEFHLRDYWKMVVRRRRLLVVVFFAVFLFGAYLTFAEIPMYTAGATLKIEPHNPAIMQLQELVALQAGGGGTYDYYQTQFALLTSRPLAARVIKELGLEDDPIFSADLRAPMARLIDWPISLLSSTISSLLGLIRTPIEEELGQPKDPEYEFGVHPGFIGRYLSFLMVDPIPNTRLVQIVFTTPDATLSQKLANIHSATFIRTTLETRFEMTGEARDFLEKKLAELKESVQTSEKKLQHFRQTHGVVSMQGNENLVIERMININNRLTEAQTRRIELESLSKTLENRNARNLSEIIDNQLIQQLKTTILTLEGEHTRHAATFTPEHPRVQELNRQIADAQQRLNREVNTIVRKIGADHKAALAKEKGLQEEAQRQQEAALRLKEVGVDYGVLQADVESSRTLHDSILRRLHETTLSNDVPVTNIQISERAERPLTQSSPDAGRNLILAAACGLFLGIGLVFFLEYIDPRMSTPEDVWQATSVPTLGIIPHQRFLPRSIIREENLSLIAPVRKFMHQWVIDRFPHNQELMVKHHPLSIISESFRTIRTALLFSQDENPPQVVLLSSAHPGEGKTVTTLNLAAALAQGGNRVVVIDADLRKGRCHTVLGRPNHRGLSHVLSGRASLDESIQATPVSDMYFLPRGEMTLNPTELLGSYKMQEVIEYLRRWFDFVLIDTAPAIVVSDASVLSRLCDGVLLVVRGQRTTADSARRLVERLQTVRAPILGVVLNGVDIRGPDYADYRQYYNSYYASPQPPGEMAS